MKNAETRMSGFRTFTVFCIMNGNFGILTAFLLKHENLFGFEIVTLFSLVRSDFGRSVSVKKNTNRTNYFSLGHFIYNKKFIYKTV